MESEPKTNPGDNSAIDGPMSTLKFMGLTFLVSVAALLFGCSAEEQEVTQAIPTSPIIAVSFMVELPDGRVECSLSEEGTPLSEVLRQTSLLTGRQFAQLDQNLAAKKINMIGKKTIGKQDILAFVQVLLYCHDLAVVPSNDGDLEVLVVEDIKTSHTLK